MFISVKKTVFEIAGIVIGYVIVGGSKLYQMTCKKEDSKKIANISARLTKQLDRYTESQNKLFQVTVCLLDSEFNVIGKVIHPKYYKHLKKGAIWADKKMEWFLAN